MDGRNVITRRITPACENTGATIKTVGVILVILAIMLIIFLIISVIYNQYRSNDTGTDDGAGGATRAVDGETISNVLQVISIILSVGVAGIGIWHVVVSNNFVRCVSEGSTIR